MRISIIVAVADNGVIGAGNELPWHVSADLKRFKRLTMGHSLVLGRKTWESIGRPLPGRRMVVITRRADYAADGVEVAHSLNEALELCRDEDEVFVAGGGEIYRAALPAAHRLYLTRIRGEFEGDVHFPKLEEDVWRLSWEEGHKAESEDGPSFDFQTYERLRDRD